MTSPRHAAWACAVITLLGVANAHQQRGKPIKIPNGLPVAVKKTLQIASAKTSGWATLSITPAQLLAKADQWLSHAHAVSGEERYVFETAYGYGTSPGQLAIETPKKFRVNYCHVEGSIRAPEISQTTMVANGEQVQSQDSFGISKKAKVSKSRVKEMPFDSWTTKYQTLMFSGLGTNDKPFAALLQSAVAAGLKVTAEHRTLGFDQAAASMDRVLITGKAKSNGKLANYQVEILLDAGSHALMTMRFRRDGVSEYHSFWSVRWNFMPGQTFPQSLFKMFS